MKKQPSKHRFLKAKGYSYIIQGETFKTLDEIAVKWKVKQATAWSWTKKGKTPDGDIIRKITEIL